MPISEQGRICQQCQKTLIDFRKLSDEEVMQIHMSKTGSVCGIYRKDQLEYPKQPKSASKTKALLFTLSGLLTTGKVTAHNSEPKEQIIIPLKATDTYKKDSSQKQQASLHNEIKTDTDSLIISGFVYDRITNTPMIGAFVMIKHTKIGVTTDTSGRYILNLSAMPDSIQYPILVYGSTAYKSVEVHLDKYSPRNNSLELNTFLEPSVFIEDFGVRRASLGRRIIRGIGKLFKKK